VRATVVAVLLVVAAARSLVSQEAADTFSARITKELARPTLERRASFSKPTKRATVEICAEPKRSTSRSAK